MNGPVKEKYPHIRNNDEPNLTPPPQDLYYQYYPPPNKSKMPFYLAIITQNIIQIFLLIMIAAYTSQQSRNDFLFNPTGIWLILWVVSSLLVVSGVIMVAITVFISLHYWNGLDDDNYLICIASAILGLFIGGGLWYLYSILPQ
jgi:hypothetical protein